MSPGKSQISKESVTGSRGSSGGGAHMSAKRHIDSIADSLASQLQNETEEKKEIIMNEAINCIFNQLPEDMCKLDSLLSELTKLSNTHYSSDAWLEQQCKNDGHTDTSNPIAAKYKFAFDSAKKALPRSDHSKKSDSSKQQTQSSDGLVNGKQLLQCICARHLIGPNGQPLEASEGHTCVKSYTFPNSINLFPWGTVAANEELSKFIDELRSIFVQLSQHFVNINLGLSLMFPRTEDNETSNLSLEVLSKLLDLASLDYLDFFESNVSNRAHLIETVCVYPHFGESRRMLFEYDRNACLQLQMLVQNLISQCGRLYDSLVKNFDMVLKAKEQCNQQTRPQSPDSVPSSPSNSIYS